MVYGADCDATSEHTDVYRDLTIPQMDVPKCSILGENTINVQS